MTATADAPIQISLMARPIRRRLIKVIERHKGSLAIIEVNPNKKSTQFAILTEAHKKQVNTGWILNICTDKQTIQKIAIETTHKNNIRIEVLKTKPELASNSEALKSVVNQIYEIQIKANKESKGLTKS